MRYHKAAKISQLEAKFIIDNNTTSRGACVVIEHYGNWFDVRHMTDDELNSFIDDLNRARLADEAPGLSNVH